MKLLELAKKNLQEFISIRDALELISNTQQTPLSYVAIFLISQNFEANISTYDADKYYVIHSNDNWNWGQFEYTSSILSALADNDKYKEIYVFDESDIPENLKDTYWKRSELYNLNLIKDLSLGYYFRAEDIKNIVGNRSLNLDEFESNDNFSDDEVRKLLKSGIPSYLPNSVEKFSQIDEFVKSIIEFFECDFDKGLIIQKDELKELLCKLQIIIKGFNDNLSNSTQLESCNIWDDNYLNIALNDSYDMDNANNDLPIFELPDLEPDSQLIQTKEIPLFYLNDTLTVIEASCIISGDNPAEILEIQDNSALLASYKKFRNAKSLIESAINLRTLNEYTDIGIATHEFKTFLASKKIFIDDFNNNLDKKDYIDELTEQIQSQLIYISQIENEVGFYQRLSHNSLWDADFDKLLEAEHGETFRLRGEKGVLEQKVLVLEKKLESSQAEIDKLNTISSNYSQSGDELIQSLDSITPEQEIPNSRKRNNILKIISILSQMADLPHEPFTAFNVLEAFAIQNNKDIPSKHTVADWLKRARDSN